VPDHSTPDMVIRSRLAAAGTEFVVVDGKSHHVIGGPFAALTDAISFALGKAKPSGRRIMYEAIDERGRVISAPMLIKAADDQ
jgi:hypothetical protein